MRRDVLDLIRSRGGGHGNLVVAVAAGGERIVAGWAGPGDLAPDALFEIGSITKPFTGTLLAEMHLRGDVDCADPLSRHLPAEGAPAWPGPEPTLADLATHRSGLPNVPRGMLAPELAMAGGLTRADPWRHVDAGAYRRMVSRTVPKPPGKRRIRYSSLAFALLGEALARRAGTPYERLLTERVLAPLGLADIAVTVPPDARHGLREGHSARGSRRPVMDDLMAPAGSLRASAPDLLRFLLAVLDPPPGTLGEALVLARTPRVRVGSGPYVGLGWFLLRRGGRPDVVWHNGGTWGFRSLAALVPRRGVAVVVLSGRARSVDRLGLDLVKAALRSAPRV